MRTEIKEEFNLKNIIILLATVKMKKG